jgi:hypothetical protein
MSFALDRYEPVAFHTHPDLMRAAEAQTEVLHAGAPPPMSAPAPTPQPVRTPSPAPAPVAEPSPVFPPTQAPPAPVTPEPIAAYLVGMDATPLLRAHLADFLDAAGTRRDVRVSVGLAAGGDVVWVLRDQVPYGVRALPRYPDLTPMSDVSAALAATAAAMTADGTGEPGRRQLVVLLWDRCPEPVERPPALASTLVLHCVDAVLSPPPTNGVGGGSWVLARSRPGLRPSLLAHAGLLLDGWESFADPPVGLWLGRLPERA